MDIYIIIKYRWQYGIYGLEDMVGLVENKILSKQQFFEITRYNYDGVKSIRFNEK